MCRVEPAGSEQSGTPHDKPSRHSSKMSLINAMKSYLELDYHLPNSATYPCYFHCLFWKTWDWAATDSSTCRV